MNDETKAELMKRTREWLQSCVNAATRSGVPEEADLEAFILAHLDGEEARRTRGGHMNDDVKGAVERFRKAGATVDSAIQVSILFHIDGEQARQDAAVAAAREEQREVIHDRLNTLGSAGTRSPADLGIILRIVGETPLTATPLADRIAELEAFGRKVSAIRDSIVGSQQFNWSEHAYPLVAALGAAGFEGEGHKIASENFGTLLDRLEKAEAERDALFVSHANLAAVLADINEAVGGAAGEEPSLVRAVRTLVAERDALRSELADLIPLAESAMRQANNDGAEYDIKAELADARRVAEANMQTAERTSQSIDAMAAERDALRAQVSELEECKQEGDDVEVAAQRLRFWAENPYACPVHFGARTACGQCYDSERALRRSTEAQVEAARALCADFDRGGGLMWPHEVIAAMDGAKPK